jgi:hypothetical protein
LSLNFRSHSCSWLGTLSQAAPSESLGLVAAGSYVAEPAPQSTVSRAYGR